MIVISLGRIQGSSGEGDREESIKLVGRSEKICCSSSTLEDLREEKKTVNAVSPDDSLVARTLSIQRINTGAYMPSHGKSK